MQMSVLRLPLNLFACVLCTRRPDLEYQRTPHDLVARIRQHVNAYGGHVLSPLLRFIAGVGRDEGAPAKQKRDGHPGREEEMEDDKW